MLHKFFSPRLSLLVCFLHIITHTQRQAERIAERIVQYINVRRFSRLLLQRVLFKRKVSLI